MAKILCIDDEPFIRLATGDWLCDLGHEVLEAANGAEGIAVFRKHRPDLVLTDLRMPGGDGFLVVAHLAEEAPNTPVVIISGTGTVDEAVKTLRLGAWDYLTKPLTDMNLLATTVERLLAKAGERRQAQAYVQGLADKNKALEEQVADWADRHQEASAKLAGLLRMGIGSLLRALAEKDPATAGHNERVAAIAVDMGRALGLDEEAQDTLLIAGLLHDIGKIGVPRAVLNKPNPLTPEEFERVRNHVVCAERILKDIPFHGPVLQAVLQHHERFNGTGYPLGICGENILLEARILAVADVYEALTSDRPYRRALCPADAAAHMAEQAGRHFCPACVEALAWALAHAGAGRIAAKAMHGGAS